MMDPLWPFLRPVTWVLVACFVGLIAFQAVYLNSLVTTPLELKFGLLFPFIVGAALGRIVRPRHWAAFFELGWLLLALVFLAARLHWTNTYLVAFACVCMFGAQSLVMLWRNGSEPQPGVPADGPRPTGSARG